MPPSSHVIRHQSNLVKPVPSLAVYQGASSVMEHENARKGKMRCRIVRHGVVGRTSLSVPITSVSHQPLFVTMTMTAEIWAMKCRIAVSFVNGPRQRSSWGQHGDICFYQTRSAQIQIQIQIQIFYCINNLQSWKVGLLKGFHVISSSLVICFFTWLTLCEGNPLDTVDSPHKGSVLWRAFSCHDIIMKIPTFLPFHFSIWPLFRWTI